MGKITAMAFTFFLALIMAGCGGDGGNDFSVTSSISGKVRVTSSTNSAAKLLTPVIAANISGLTPAGAGITVQLVRLDNQGNVTTVLATTTTDISGAYTFSGSDIPTPDVTLAVRAISGPSVNMRALVTSNQVDISPVSETVFRSIIAGGSVDLSNFSTQEITALNYLLLGMGIDVSGKTFDEAVTALETASGSILATLITSYANPSIGTDIQGYFYNTISTKITLFDPFSLIGASAGGIGLATGIGGGTFDVANTMVKGSLEAIVAPLLHDLSTVTQSGGDPNLDIASLEGWTHAINPQGQVIVWDSSGNGVLGAVTADASLMVYPETGNIPANGAPYIALSRGIRIATAGNSTFGTISSSPQIGFDNTFLDDIGVGGTTYHLVRLSQTLSSALGNNAVTVSTATGDLTFDSANVLAITDTLGQPIDYAGLAANTLTTDPLTLDLVANTATSGPPGTTAIGGALGAYYNVHPFSGNLTFRDNDGSLYPYLGLGTLTQTGEVFTLAQTPDDNGHQATDDATGTHVLAVAIRQTPGVSAPVTLSPGTYNAVEYAYYLSGDGASASVASAYKVGTLTLSGDGTTVSGGSLISNLASLDIVAAKAATANALSALPSAAPEEAVSGAITAPAADGTTTLSLTIGANTVTGSGAVTSNGEFIVAAIKIADGSSTDIGRGLLFLIRQPN